MICGLFSSFDPGVMYGTSGLNFKWVGLLFLVLIPWWQLFILPVGKDLIIVEIYLSILSSLKDSSPGNYSKISLMLVGTFMSVLSMNWWGMVPFFFSSSSHLSVDLPLSISLWLSGVIYMIFSSLKSFFSHSVPLGSPMFLWPLLVMVESVSLFIRPITLSIRLMANVMSGHLIMSLVGHFISFQIFFFPLSIIFIGSFVLFEICISVVQAYVFMSLISLYWKESEEH